MLKKEEAIPWPGTLAIVHSYIAYKAGKEIPYALLCNLPLFKKKKKKVLEGRICFVLKRKFNVKNEKLLVNEVEDCVALSWEEEGEVDLVPVKPG